MWFFFKLCIIYLKFISIVLEVCNGEQNVYVAFILVKCILNDIIFYKRILINLFLNLKYRSIFFLQLRERTNLRKSKRKLSVLIYFVNCSRYLLEWSNEISYFKPNNDLQSDYHQSDYFLLDSWNQICYFRIQW